MFTHVSRYLKVFTICEVILRVEPVDMPQYSCVIFRHCTKNVNKEGFERSEISHSIIDLTQSEEAIFNKFEKDNTQRPILRAEKMNLDIRVNEGYGDFIKISSEFNKARGIPEVIVPGEISKENGVLYSCYIDGNLVMGNYFVPYGDIFYYYQQRSVLPFTEDEEKKKIIGYMNRYTHWLAIKYAKSKGFKEYDFGGVNLNDKGVYLGVSRFKASFGGSIVMRYNYIKDYSTALRAFRKSLQFTVNGLHKIGIYNLPFKGLSKIYSG